MEKFQITWGEKLCSTNFAGERKIFFEKITFKQHLTAIIGDLTVLAAKYFCMTNIMTK